KRIGVTSAHRAATSMKTISPGAAETHSSTCRLFLRECRQSAEERYSAGRKLSCATIRSARMATGTWRRPQELRCILRGFVQGFDAAASGLESREAENRQARWLIAA